MSCAISWVRTYVAISRPEGAERLGGLLGADLLARQALEDLATLRLAASVPSPVELVEVGVRGPSSSRVRGVAEAEGAHERVDPAADGGVADAELALHLLEVAARAKEALQQADLLAVEPPEAADAELALERGAAAAAVEAGDGQLARSRPGRWR